MNRNWCTWVWIENYHWNTLLLPCRSIFLRRLFSRELVFLSLMPSSLLSDKQATFTRLMRLDLWKKSTTIKQSALVIPSTSWPVPHPRTLGNHQVVLVRSSTQVDSLLKWLTYEQSDSFNPFLMLHSSLAIIILVCGAKKWVLKSVHSCATWWMLSAWWCKNQQKIVPVSVEENIRHLALSESWTAQVIELKVVIWSNGFALPSCFSIGGRTYLRWIYVLKLFSKKDSPFSSLVKGIPF